MPSARGFRLIRNILLDLRFGEFLGGTLRTGYAQYGSEDIANSDYAVLPLIFGGRVKASDVLVDVGCGKGRVINWWLNAGFRNRIIGVELDTEVARKTRQRLRAFPNVEIIEGDINEHFPADGTIFYLFNPFKAFVVDTFKNRLNRLIADSGRKDITILYYNCIHADVFRLDPRWNVEKIELGASLGFHPLAVIQLR